jgi:superfamily II DNA or RNA helicase
MPRGIYTNISCASDEKEVKFEPTKHQQDTLNYFLNSKYKGLLLYHKLGSGKTCTSIMIADEMLKIGLVKHVYILTPGSLRQGWVGEYCRVCGETADNLENKYTFITYNYMVGRSLPDFTDTLVIIDEVHNLINGAKNMSDHPTLIYDKLLETKCRILALSGTPIFNYVHEFALLGNLLKPGGDFPEIRKKDNIDPEAFMKFFITKDDGTLVPQNLTKIKRKFEGIISYYPGAGREFVPEVIEMPIIKVQMTPLQEINYWQERIKEQKMNHPPNRKLMAKNPKLYKIMRKLYIMSSKNILSRSASNFNYLPGDRSKLDLPEDKGGWIAKDKFKNGELFRIHSTKISALIINIVMHIKQKHVLFTFFKEKSGVNLIKSLLGLAGINAEIFSGDLDDGQRNRLLRQFNSAKNRYGDVIRVLLVTEAGAEGISVLEARHMHILESSPRISKTIQAIGRVARYKSHIKLPPEERKIKIWKYWSVASPEDMKVPVTYHDPEGEEKKEVAIVTNKTTVDEILYNQGMKNIKQVNSFLDLIKNVSVTEFTENKN